MHLRACLFVITLFFLVVACSSSSDNSPTPELLESKLKGILEQNDLSSSDKDDSLRQLMKFVRQEKVRNEMIFKISYHFYRGDDSILFRKWNEKSRNLSLKLKDTAKIAESHWDLANFYYQRNVLDSAFINYGSAHRLYKSIDSLSKAGRMLYNMAVIQEDIGYFTGSEQTSVESMKLAEETKNHRLLYKLENNLGIIYNEMKEYDKALVHHFKALAHNERMQNSLNEATSLNNLGVVFQNMNKHDISLNYFQKALVNENLSVQNPRLFAMLLDNRAYSRMLIGDSSGIKKEFLKALDIRENIGDLGGTVSSKIHLSEYHALAGDTLAAHKFALEANVTAKKTESNRDILASYLLLSKFDPIDSETHLRNHIKLDDSLQHQERTLRNKFIKIKYETDHVIEENKQLHEQKSILIGLSLGVGLLALSGFVIGSQRTKNRELKLKQRQQHADQKILQLLVDQQNLEEKGRQKERQRVSEELHDGVLAKLFGLGLSLSSLNTRTDETSIEKRGEYLSDLRNLGVEIRQLSHELNSPLFTSSTNYLSVLENVLQKGKDYFSYELEVDDEVEWEIISGSVKIHLLRILQEAVKNILQHSHAEQVIVQIEGQNNKLIMTIIDDGLGFHNQKKNSGIGLKNMKSRAKEIRGNLEINSIINKGTRITLRVPIS